MSCCAILSKTLELENPKESINNHFSNGLLPICKEIIHYVMRNNYIDINALEKSSMHKSQKKCVEVGCGLVHKYCNNGVG